MADTTRNKRIVVYMDSGLFDRLNEYVEEKQTTRNEVCLKAIREYLNRYDHKK
jgi:metal-responsive CopG/Arc/MetJ family transcriptional regulator